MQVLGGCWWTVLRRIFTNYSWVELLTITLWSGSWRRGHNDLDRRLGRPGRMLLGLLCQGGTHKVWQQLFTHKMISSYRYVVSTVILTKLINSFQVFSVCACVVKTPLLLLTSCWDEDNKLVWLEIDNWARVSPGHQYRPRQSGVRTNTSQATHQPPNKLPTIKDCENFWKLEKLF